MGDATSKRELRDEIGSLPPGNVVNEVADLNAFLTRFGGQDIRVQIQRMEPTSFRGVKTKGVVDTIDELVDEDWIRDHYGGGKYCLRVFKRDKNGRMPFAGSTTFEIAGNPKLPVDDADPAQQHAGGDAGVALAGQAMSVMQQQLREERAAKSNAGGIDHGLLRAMQEPVIEQLRTAQASNERLQQELAAKEDRLITLLTHRNDAPPGGTVQDRIFEKMIDGESARIESIRTQHDSEIRQLKNLHQAELDRERDRGVRDLDRLEKQHTRELDSLRDAQKFSTDAMKTTYETRIDSLKGEIARLQGEMLESKTVIGELKAKKEKSLPEQAQEIVAMQEALKSIGIGKDEDEDAGKSVLERIAGRLLENPEAIGQLVGGVRGATGPSQEEVAAQQQAQMLAAQQHQARQIAAKRKAKKMRAQAAEGVAAPQNGEVKHPLAGLSEAEVGLAVRFMEGAVQNGTDPVVFASSARSAIPGDILAAIEKMGIDEFLNSIALPQDSNLRSQRGRNFARTVAQTLLQGAT